MQDPGKVFKGKKMAGHLGAKRTTSQNLMVVETDNERGLILVRGAVPGPKGGWVLIKDAVKLKMSDDLPFPAALRGDAVAEEAVEEGATPEVEAGADADATPEAEQAPETEAEAAPDGEAAPEAEVEAAPDAEAAPEAETAPDVEAGDKD